MINDRNDPKSTFILIDRILLIRIFRLVHDHHVIKVIARIRKVLCVINGITVVVINIGGGAIVYNSIG